MSEKDLKKLRRRLLRQGFRLRRCGSGHWLVRAPRGGTTTMPGTPGRGRSMANTRAELKRIGAEL